MKQVMLAFTVLSAFLPTAATFTPQTVRSTCSATEWVWDTFFGGLGCTFK